MAGSPLEHAGATGSSPAERSLPASHGLSLTAQALMAQPAAFGRPLRTLHSLPPALSPVRPTLAAPGVHARAGAAPPGSPEDIFSIQTPSVVKSYISSQV